MTEPQAREIYQKFAHLRDIMSDEGGCVHSDTDVYVCYECERDILVSLLKDKE